MSSAPPPLDASAATVAAHDRALAALRLDDADFDDATRGRIAVPKDAAILGPRGWPVWNFERTAFLQGDAPPTVHPGLWRLAKLNAIAGLFEVCPGIHQ